MGSSTPDLAEGSGRVADAAPGNWTQLLPTALRPYAQLARWDRPIGWWLLLWPCWWSVGLALNASVGAAASFRAVSWGEAALLLALFWVGAVAMRGAGCTWNDVTDRHLDAGVARTRSRPIPSGRVGVSAALVFLVVQLLIGLAVLVALAVRSPSPATVLVLGFLAVPIVVAYPFAKRVTDWPQIVLGLAFSWGALMGWTAMFGVYPTAAPLLLYAGCLAWVVGYDTIYAHQDREDDALMGIRSTARLFGRSTGKALVVIYAVALCLMASAFALAGVPWPAWVGLALAGAHMAHQIRRLDIEDAGQCLALFKSNTRIGWIVFAGLIAGAILTSPSL